MHGSILDIVPDSIDHSVKREIHCKDYPATFIDRMRDQKGEITSSIIRSLTASPWRWS